MIHLLNDFDLTAIHRLFNAMDDALSPAGDATDEEKAAFHIQGLSFSDVVWKDITPEQFTAMEAAFTAECEKIADEMERAEEAGEPIDTKLMPKRREDIKKISTFYKHFAAVMATPHYRIIPYMGSPDTFAHTFAPIKDTGKPLYTFKAKVFADLNIEQDVSIWAETLSYPNYYTDNGALPITPAQLHRDANIVYYNISGQDLCEQWLSRSKVRDMEELLKRTAAEGGVEGFKYINDGINYEIDVVFIMATRIYLDYLQTVQNLQTTTNAGAVSQFITLTDMMTNTVFSGDLLPNTEQTVYVNPQKKNIKVPISYSFNDFLDDAINTGAISSSRPLDYEDKMIFFAFCTVAFENSGAQRVIDIKHLYEIIHKKGYTDCVRPETLNKLAQRIDDLIGVTLKIDITELIAKWNNGKDIDNFKQLLPATLFTGKRKVLLIPVDDSIVATDRNGNVCKCVYNVIGTPVLMRIAEGLHQLIATPPEYYRVYDFAKPLDKGKYKDLTRAASTTRINDYLAQRLKIMVNAQSNGTFITSSIAFSNIYERYAGKKKTVYGDNEMTRAETTTINILKSWELNGIIKGYHLNPQKTPAGRTKSNVRYASIDIELP